MKLRKLELKDAPFMLEWMHDESVVENLQTNFASKTLDDCQRFIEFAQDLSTNVNLAIVDDQDEYMGTVSLKNLTKKHGEFAITIRKCAMGKGFSKFGMKKIIEYGLNERNLEEVYWCVSPVNKRAVRFYEKNGYQRFNIVDSIEYETVKQHYSAQQIDQYDWFVVKK